MKATSYSASITPAVLGVLIGGLLSTISHGTHTLSTTYADLPEFHLWRTGIVAQAAIYFAVSAFIWLPHTEWSLPQIPRAEILLTGFFTMLVVTLPNLAVQEEKLPLPWQNYRLGAIIFLGLTAVLGITYRVAQLHQAFRTVEDLSRYIKLRQQARDLLGLAALVVTMATLGSGLLQISLAALADAPVRYKSPITDSHVIAYGGYFSLLLVLFFTPLLASERLAALQILEKQREDARADLEDRLGLQSSFTENARSTFGVLAPLLGALATRLLS